MKQKTESPVQQTKYNPEGRLESGFMFDVESAYAYFERVKDKRKARGLQYPLPAILTLCVLAKLGGENTPAGIADWAKHRAEWLCDAMGLKRRTASAIQAEVNIGGKKIRGTITADNPNGVYLLAVFMPGALRGHGADAGADQGE